MRSGWKGEKMKKPVNAIRFYERAQNDERLSPYHLSLYLALFWSWQKSGYQSSFPVCRKFLMTLAKIQSIATYHKCIREMSDFGYIEYKPSYNYYKGSRIKLLCES